MPFNSVVSNYIWLDYQFLSLALTKFPEIKFSLRAIGTQNPKHIKKEIPPRYWMMNILLKDKEKNIVVEKVILHTKH